MERKRISESDGEQKQWMEDAKAMTADKLPKFINHLIQDYVHDYGTICHAIAAAAIAAAWSVERGPSGGITGFQAGAVMWEIINGWGVFGDGPKRMVTYKDMLYPQYATKFRSISSSTWDYLKAEAKKNLDGNIKSVSPDVVEHWKSIVAGEIPFGYQIERD